jgi:hypothetical protein
VQPVTQAHPVSKGSLWTGRIRSALTVAFLLFDGVSKVIKASVAVKGTVDLGFPESAVAPIGAALLVGTALYAIPRTSILGAILLTGYLGGAVATRVRAGNSLFGCVLFRVYVGVMVWRALFLRDSGVRALLLPGSPIG